MQAIDVRGFTSVADTVTPSNDHNETEVNWSNSPRRRLSQDFPPVVDNGYDDGEIFMARKDIQRNSSIVPDESMLTEKKYTFSSSGSRGHRSISRSDSSSSGSRYFANGSQETGKGIGDRKVTYFDEKEPYSKQHQNIPIDSVEDDDVLSDIEWWNKMRDDALQDLRESNGSNKKTEVGAIMYPFSVLQRSPESIDLNYEDELIFAERTQQSYRK